MTLTQLKALNGLLDAVISHHTSLGMDTPTMDGMTLNITPCGCIVWFPFVLPDDIAQGRCAVTSGSMFII